MKKLTVTDVILLVLSTALCLGVKLVFHACGPKEDGSWMTCHWAEQAVFAVSIGMMAIAVVRLFLERREKAGAALAMSLMGVMTALIPNVMIRLCMMSEMRCHAVMHPAVVILSVLTAIAGAADFVLSRKEGGK
ncbi:MAG: DUF4418 family protein [Oscillospiraceae bacterium]|nr:DUF4418 family protein [Oscillospiraceae bacterium]